MQRTRWIPVPVLVAGVCALSVPPVATAVDRTRACDHPADTLDLANWKETLPTESSGRPTEVKQPELTTRRVSFAGLTVVTGLWTRFGRSVGSAARAGRRRA